MKTIWIISTALLCLAGLMPAQEEADNTPSTPRFVVMPPKPATAAVREGAAVLPTWYGSFTYGGKTYHYNMVGTAPRTNTSTTVQALIIPIKIVISSATETTTYDPARVLSNGKTVIQNTVDSPLFDATTKYVQGGLNVGTTQYIDAYQRASFWATVSSHRNYHLLLGGPTVLAGQTLSPSVLNGRTGQEFGFKAAKVGINWFDAQIQTIMQNTSQIQPNTIPIFLIYDTYLTQDGCCIGGYHSAVGAQAYIVASYADVVGAFSQDVSALSHELGEWADDPLVNGYNYTPCGILEVGDPLEGNANYGAYAYSVNGFTYDLQDLVTLPYFGAPPGTSVKKFFTFQGESLTVCQNGS